jgi:hypothetical protein
MDTAAVALIKLGLIGSGRRTTCPSARGSGFVAVTDSQHTLTDSQREWLEVRGYLVERRHELAVSAASRDPDAAASA